MEHGTSNSLCEVVEGETSWTSTSVGPGGIAERVRMDPGVADGESERLRILEEYDILDSIPEEEYQDITELASQLCLTPISLITFIDSGRQWIKAGVGFSAQETLREISFCTHAITGPCELIVPDATTDPRFCNNPFVVTAPFIRFYAGVPLMSTEGLGLGTLCVLDRVPRQLDERQHKALRLLANHVMKLLELRRIRSRGLASLLGSRSSFLALCKDYEALLKLRSMPESSYRVLIKALLLSLDLRDDDAISFDTLTSVSTEGLSFSDGISIEALQLFPVAIFLAELLYLYGEHHFSARVLGRREVGSYGLVASFSELLSEDLQHSFGTVSSLFERHGAGRITVSSHQVDYSFQNERLPH